MAGGSADMTAALSSSSSGSALWFLSRGTGVVSLALLTVVMVLGVLTRGGRPLPGAPRFVTAGLHRNAALLAVSLLVVHIATAVADPYAPVRIIDAIVPFASAYRPLWLGFGALALDLLVAVVVTSLLRLRLRPGVFRTVHWAAYAVWPVALLHGLGTGSDVHAPWMLLTTAGCVLAVLSAVLWRVARLSVLSPGRRSAVVAGAAFAPIALIAFLVAGPLAPHWAARAGTPTALIRSASFATTASAGTGAPATTAARPAGTGAVHGTVTERVNGGSAVVVLAGSVTGGDAGQLQIVLRGAPADGGGVALTSGSVRLSPAGGATYTGPVTGLNGGQVSAQLTGPAGAVSMVVDVQPNSAAGTFDGTVRLA